MAPSTGHLVVVGALLHRDGRYLVNQRPQGKWGAGMWEFPGGKVHIGEDPRRALEREAHEELGCEIRAGAIFDIISHSYDFGSVLLIFIECDLLSGEPRPMENNHLEWVAPGDFHKFDFLPADIPIIRALEERHAR